MRQRLRRVGRKTPSVAFDRVGEIAGVGERKSKIQQHACLVGSDLERLSIGRDRSRGIASLAVAVGGKAERKGPAFADRVVEGVKLLERTREKRADSRIVSPGEMQARQSQRALIQVIALRQAFEPLHHVLGDRKSTRLNSSHVKISYAV